MKGATQLTPAAVSASAIAGPASGNVCSSATITASHPGNCSRKTRAVSRRATDLITSARVSRAELRASSTVSLVAGGGVALAVALIRYLGVPSAVGVVEV